jgi:rhomboid family GlyGly-CTERM serine protease
MLHWQDIIPQQALTKHICFAVFAGLLLLMGLLPESWIQLLEYSHVEAFSWRWLTAHFVHLGFYHALMNVACAVVLWLLVVAYVPSLLLIMLLFVLPFGISVGLGLKPAEFSSYRGFSGALYGFFAAGILWGFWYQRLLVCALGVFLTVKIAVEQMPNFDNAYLLSTIGGLVAVDAHLYGVLVGVLCTVVYVFLAVLGAPYCYRPWIYSQK